MDTEQERPGGFVQRLPFYIGGFLGPFGTFVIVPMFPELRSEFDATSSQVNLGFSLYLFAFAALLLFSGTIGERLGRRRTVRATYILYTVASLAAALAPSLTVFVAARVVQGIANAFITPLMLAGLAELVSKDRFGREVGIYSSFQAFGGGIGPIVGGLAADTVWQAAFFGTAAIAGVLALNPPEGAPRPAAKAPPVRALLTGRMVALGVAFLAAATGPIGIAVVVGVVARDELDLSGTVAGLVLVAGAASAMALGPLWGRLVDVLGKQRAGIVASSGSIIATCLLGLGTNAWSLGILWAIGGGVSAFVAVVFQAIGATAVPGNRGGALSFLLSFRFVGHALGPLIFVPLLGWSVAGTFVAAALLGLIPILVLWQIGVGDA